jgi:hypothetical protein
MWTLKNEQMIGKTVISTYSGTINGTPYLLVVTKDRAMQAISSTLCPENQPERQTQKRTARDEK